jgi:hypothetical protein
VPDPALHKWSMDRLMAHNLLSISPYVYCHNNPLNRLDPDGLVDWKRVGKGALTMLGGGIETTSGITVGLLTSPTIVGSGIGGILATHGIASMGFGLANTAAGFAEQDQYIPYGPLEAFGSVVDQSKWNASNKGQIVGKTADSILNILSGGNPIKNVKNIIKLIPTSARELSKNPNYLIGVVKEALKLGSTADSAVKTGTSIDEYINEVKKDNEEEESKNNP